MSAARDLAPLPPVLTDADWGVDFEFYGADASVPLDYDGSSFSLVLAKAGQAKPASILELTSGAGRIAVDGHLVSVSVPQSVLAAWPVGLHSVELRRTQAGVTEALYLGSVVIARGLSQLPSLGGGAPLPADGASAVQVFRASDDVRVIRGDAAGQALAARNAAAATAADRVQTGLDRTQTGLDRVQTGQDRTQTGADRVATGQDRSATAADRTQTGADRVQTGADRAATQSIAASLSQTVADANAAAAFANSQRGWSPQFVVEADGSRRVLRIVGWAGGTGTAPTTAGYLGASGVVSTAAAALDIRGTQGPKLFEAVYASKAALDADLAYSAGAFGLVYNDATAANNGTYVKAGASGAGSWVQNGSVLGLVFQPLPIETGFVMALVDSAGRAAFMVRTDGTFVPIKIALPSGSVLTASIADAAITLAKLASEVSTPLGLAPKAMDVKETGYVWALVDSASRIAMAVKPTGEVILPKFTIPAASVGLTQLKTELSGLLPATLSAESGYVWALVDSAGRIGLGVKTDGTVVGKISGLLSAGSVQETHLAAGAVSARALDPAIARQAVSYDTDVVEVHPGPWRADFADVGVRTAADGSFWEPFPRALTSNLRGINGAGTSLDIRKASGLPFRGKRYCGTFDPGAQASTRQRSTFTSASSYPPAPSTPLAGDYFYFTDPTALTSGSDTFNLGDLSVYTGSAWVKQAAPTPFGGGAYSVRQPGDWWAVTAAGTFDGVTYAVGDRIVYVGFQSASGLGYARWAKGSYAKGDLFYRGEFNPASGLPSSPADGEVWQASAAGAAGGFTFAVGDYLVREAGAWGQVPTDTIRTVASGAFVSLPCAYWAAEWEVRRTDKSATRVGALLKSRRQVSPRRNRDDLVLYSDSMFGVSNVGGLILSKTGRTGVVFSFGGGTSRDVQAMMEYEIAALGDRYRGAVHVCWHGQNNQPSTSTDANAAQIREATLRMVEMIGAREKRFVFMSILGQRNASWNGSRIVCTQPESAFASTGVLYDLEQWYAKTMPGQWISPRLALLAAAVGRTTPDPQFPGMTEAQVAATCGIVPFSFYNNAQNLPVAAASLVYRGTWSTSGLPTGGTANDYYIRTGGGTVGNLLINVAGTWTEFALDVTHLSPTGADALATAVAALITANKF